MAKISDKITLGYIILEPCPEGGQYTVTLELGGGRRTARHHHRYLDSIELKEVSLSRALQFIKRVLKNGFQDLERTWMTVDLVYKTRWDCPVAPERVRQVA